MFAQQIRTQNSPDEGYVEMQLLSPVGVQTPWERATMVHPWYAHGKQHIWHHPPKVTPCGCAGRSDGPKHAVVRRKEGAQPICLPVLAWRPLSVVTSSWKCAWGLWVFQ